VHPKERQRARLIPVVACLVASLLSGCVTVSTGSGPTGLPEPSGPPATTASPVPAPSEASGPASPPPSVLDTPDPGAIDPAAAPREHVVPERFDATLRRRLKRVADRTRQRSRVPGLAIAVRLPGGQTWTAVSGHAAFAPDRRLTADTVFAVGSITKTFVAALVLRLAEEGQLSIDDLLSTHLPDAPRADQVTLRQLLSHRSGLHNYFMSPRYSRQVFADPSRRWTYEEILRFVGSPYCAPGACYRYSNTNYVLLGRVAEVVTGQPLHALLRERFLDPLGLSRTVYQPDEPTPQDAAHGFWAYSRGFTDHTRDQSVIPHMSAASAAGAAGAMASTAGDLARWAAALYGGSVLSRASLREMTRVLPPDGYGLGTRRRVLLGHPALGHGGSLRGFEATMWYFPRSDVAIAIVSNRGLWALDRPLVDVVRIVLGQRPRPQASPDPSWSPLPGQSPPPSPAASPGAVAP
jgi:D-alanyl-D-alanine carboxypeptidase